MSIIKNHSKCFSQEHYIETIYLLQKKQKSVFNKDVVDELELSRASVSIAVNKLIKANMLIRRENEELILTESGLKLGEELYNKHKFLTNFLKKIGVDDDVAYIEACNIEHVISNNTIHKIKQFLEEHKIDIAL